MIDFHNGIKEMIDILESCLSKKAINYIHIDRLVRNKEYEKLLEIFHPFLSSHFVYIESKFTLVSKVTKTMDNFLRRCGDESYYSIKQSYCNLEYDEIWSDINTCFLVLVSRYEYRDRHFVAYLSNSFGYELGRTIFNRLKEMRMHKGLTAFFNDINANLYDYRDTIDFQLDKIIGYETSDSYVSEKWLKENQDEIDSKFYMLSEEEKRILVMYYQEKIKDREIGKYLNMHINTINQKRLRALEKLSNQTGLEIIRTRRV